MQRDCKRRPEEPSRDEPAGRKSYIPPRVTQVPLRPEEAVLGNCKINGTAGPAANNCSTYVCSTQGS